MEVKVEDNPCDTFAKDGCAVIKDFASSEEVASLNNRVVELVKNWTEPPPDEGGVFRTDERQTQAQGAEDYFISSACRVRFFWEANAERKYYPDDPVATLRQINKLGHGLHEDDPVFKAFSHSNKVCELVQKLGWKSPVLPQSMFIVKNPCIGGEVTAHQDSTFLFTEPKQSCLGLWLALHDCDLTNGCLWYRPGSHSDPVRRHFQRVEDSDGKTKMEFQQLVPDTDMTELEGKGLPEEGAEEVLRKNGFIPVECKAGDLVLIHGQVEHCSMPNKSEKPRHSFQLHLVEGPAEGIEWSQLNWLQYPEGRQFAKLTPLDSQKVSV